MLQLRLVEYSTTGERQGVLPVAKGSLVVTTQHNDGPSLQFSMSPADSGVMPDDGFLVGVEWASENGVFQPLPHHDRFIVFKYDTDGADLSKMVNYEGQSYVLWMLSKTYLHWASDAKDNERIWVEPGDNPASAGYIMYGMITESKNRGWGASIERSFNGTKDSNNVNWQSGDKVKQGWRLTDDLLKILGSLTDSGLCDWSVRGNTLDVFRPDTYGRDKTELVVGGPRNNSIPVKSDSSGIFTNLTVVPSEGNWLHLNNTGAPSKWGRLEETMTMSGTSNQAEAAKIAEPTLKAGRSTSREESFEWSPVEGDLMPWKDFRVGDKVTVKVGGGTFVRQVIGISAKQTDNATSVRVIVGDRMNSQQKKILSAIRASGSGGIVGGTGNSFPASPGPSPLAPDAPDNLVIVSNTSEWLEDGSALATVHLTWDPVTQATDGSISNVIEYEVWSRLPHENLSLDLATTDPEAFVSGWPVGQLRHVAVRAKNDRNIWSAFSLETLVTPLVPSSVVPKPPTGLVVTSNVGSFTSAGPVATVSLDWDDVTLSTDDEPIAISEYEIWKNDFPQLRVSASNGTITIPSNVEAKINVLAISDAGVKGDISGDLLVTGALPGTGTLVPTAPILSTGYGQVSATWDGEYVGGNSPYAGTVRIETLQRDTSVVLRKNIIPNPSFEFNSNGWSSLNESNISLSSGEYYSGGSSLRVDALEIDHGVTSTSPYISVTPGEDYVASAWIKGEVGKLLQIELTELDEVTVVGTSPSPEIIATGSWQRIFVSRTFSSSGNRASISIKNRTPGGNIFFVDALQLETGTVATTYFDGDTPPAGNFFYTWIGDEHNSQSMENPQGEWTERGVPFNRAGSFTLSNFQIGYLAQVRFVAYDNLGRVTGTSSVSSIPVEAIDGEDILANSVQANRLVAGSITVNQLSPTIGNDIVIEGNVTIIGRDQIIDNMESKLSVLEDGVEDAYSLASQADIAAGVAKAAADVADGKALVAQAIANDVNDGLNTQQNRFRVTGAGAEVVSADGSNLLSMTSTGVAIVQSGVTASLWDAARFIVNEAVVNKAQIGSHSFTSPSVGRTVVQPN